VTKFLDLFDFGKNFDETYTAPKREPRLGHYYMVLGIVMLMFIGYIRIWHFIYVRLDALLCGIMRVHKLPAAASRPLGAAEPGPVIHGQTQINHHGIQTDQLVLEPELLLPINLIPTTLQKAEKYPLIKFPGTMSIGIG